MSLFENLEVDATVYLPQDSDTTKKTSYNFGSGSFNIKINVIRISAEDAFVVGQELGEYRANIKGTRAADVVQGAVIVLSTGEKYQVVNQPKYQKLFNRYKVNLKEAE